MSKGLLHWPLPPKSWVTQEFGANQVCVDLATNSKYIRCDGHNPPEGYKSLYGEKGHTALDIAAFDGKELYCAQDGKVVQIDSRERSGLDVRVVSDIEGRTFLHIYEHMSGYCVHVGDEVKTGQLLGWSGHTGKATGPHLHFAVRELINGKWVPINPRSVLSEYYALDVLKLNNYINFLKEQTAKLAHRLSVYIRENGNQKGGKVE